MKRGIKVIMVFIGMLCYLLFSLPVIVFFLPRFSFLKDPLCILPDASLFQLILVVPYIHPWVIAIVSTKIAVFAVILFQVRRKTLGVALFVLATLSFLYVPYEYAMKVWERTVSVPIRVDLLFIIPFLYLLEMVVIILWVSAFFRRNIAEKQGK